jgi:hypothetical protein
MKHTLHQYWQQTTPIYPLVTFRIAFGFVMLMSTIRFILLGWIADQYIHPQFHFTYFGFHWVQPIGEIGMYVVFGALVVASIGIIFGAWYRLSAIAFFILFTYVELLDVSYYLNHYYFVSLIAGIMCFLPANKYCSFDVVRKPSLVATTIPRWTIDLLKFQISCVYFFAGIAKINTDWLLNALPLKLWLPAQDGIPIIGFLFSYSATAFVASWFGMVYDCLTPFLLMMKRTRLIAYFFVVAFHIVTGLLFQIGVFPIVMIVLTTIFFSNEFHQQIVTKISQWISIQYESAELKIANVNPLTKCIVVAYIFVQILLPFRYLLYPGNLYWTEQGYRFSWRVMLMEKAGTATFYVTDSKTGRKGFVDNSMFLNTHQEKQMSFQPDMILQFAKYLQQQYQKMGVNNPKVTAEIFVTLNGRPSELFIDSTVDLSKIEDSFEHKSWILPMKENK